MKLFTKEILNKLPKFYETENVLEEDKLLICKLFTPWSGFTWYIAEYDAEERLAFGYCTGGYEDEWGYISIAELEAIRGPGGLRIERDKWFDPMKFSELKRRGA